MNEVQLSKKTPRQESKPCYRCDKTGHDQQDCRYKYSTCNYCKNKGHLEAACRKKKKAISPERKMPEVKTIRAILKGERNRVPELQLPVKLNGSRTFDFEVDIGAGDNFLGNNTWRDLGQPHLTKSHRQFESASQHKLPVKGCVTLNSQVTQHNFPSSQMKALDFQVTELTNLNLLGTNGIQELGISVDALLNRSNSSATINVNTVFDDLKADRELQKECRQFCEFPDLFKPELGTLKNVELEIKFKPEAEPVFRKTRSVSTFAIARRPCSEL